MEIANQSNDWKNNVFPRYILIIINEADMEMTQLNILRRNKFFWKFHPSLMKTN